jgi:hypothetical protein
MLAWVARAAYAFTQIIAGPLDAQGILLFIIVTITPLSVLVSNYTLQFPLIPKLFFSDNTQNDKHVKNYKIKVKVCGFLRLEFFLFNRLHSCISPCLLWDRWIRSRHPMMHSHSQHPLQPTAPLRSHKKQSWVSHPVLNFNSVRNLKEI